MAQHAGLLKALLLLRRRRARPETYRSGLGTVVAFLTGIVLIRYLANVYIVADLSVRRDAIDLGTFLATSLGVLGAFGAAILPLSSYRYIHDALHHPRLDAAPYTRISRNTALVCDVFLRPVAAGIAILAVTTVILARIFSQHRIEWFLPMIALLAMVLAGTLILITILHAFRLSAQDCEPVEIGLLVLMLLSNPDVRMNGPTVHLLFFLNRLPAWPDVVLAMVVPGLLFVIAVCAVTVIWGATFLFSRIERTGVSSSYYSTSTRKHTEIAAFTLSLYARRSKPWFWIFAYLIIIPVAASPTASSSVRNWMFTLLPVFALSGFVKYASSFENEITDKLKISLSRRHRITLFAAPCILCLSLSAMPVMVRLIFAAF